MTTEIKTLSVVGPQKMRCGGCENMVRFALKQVPGVEQVKASHKTQLITLTFDPEQTGLDRIQQELDWIGYEVSETEMG